jgi:hypothetical protein
MAIPTKMDGTELDEELREHIARHAAAHHLRAQKLHYAETGVYEPIDEEAEAADEVRRLLELAKPALDGDEHAALHRLLEALEEEEQGHKP